MQESPICKAELGSVQDWASTMPLFHWGPIPWSFYATLAACFGFMLHVRGCKKAEILRGLQGAILGGIRTEYRVSS